MGKIIINILLMCLFPLTMIAQNFPQSIFGKQLPYTWTVPIPNGKMISTLHEDGTITSQMISGCYNCNGSGICQVCHGTGGQYWYGIGMQACGYCFGNRACRACGGKGYSVINSSTTRSGLTIGYDEEGNYYVAGNGSRDYGSSTNRVKNSEWYDCCSKVATFGMTLYHKCSNCGKSHQIGSHLCKKDSFR